ARPAAAPGRRGRRAGPAGPVPARVGRAGAACPRGAAGRGPRRLRGRDDPLAAARRDAPAQSGPQTVELARSAAQLGSRTASAFGACFGGSVWALVPTADADGFAAEWRERYLRADGAPETATTLVTRPGAPGRRVEPASA